MSVSWLSLGISPSRVGCNLNIGFNDAESCYLLPDGSCVCCSVMKVDCITVSTTPVKAAIDDHIQRLFDTLLLSLRRSINTNVQAIETFLSSAIDELSTRPQSVDEIGKANQIHSQLTAQRLQIQPLFDKAESKNKLLRSVAGGGSEQLAQLRARWDKFELMLESHTLMVKEQVR